MFAKLTSFLERLGQIATFTEAIVRSFGKRPYYVRETIERSYSVATQCVLPVMAILFPTGMISGLMGLQIMHIFGTERMLSSLLAQGIIKELSPSLAGIMIAAQAGSAISGELGTMRVREEIDALGVMAIDPIKFLVVPRLVALGLICPLINTMGCLMGMIGGYAVAVGIKGQNGGVFMANLLSFVSTGDIWTGLIKSSIFGVLVGIIACYYGYTVKGGAVGVGKAANNTVVHSILVIAIVNFFLTNVLLKVFG